MDVTPSHAADVSGTPVRRALPRRGRRTVGAWCFLDHFGPVAGPGRLMSVGPHPHIGLQTVTWLLAGEVLHRDSLGSEQLIRPGQLNLMTAGRGVAHAEESPRGAPAEIHGAQLWVALPDADRDRAPAFEHHEDLPVHEPGAGVTATVLVGSLGGVTSPADVVSPLVGAQLAIAAGSAATFELVAEFEHALVALDGELEVDGVRLAPGALGYLAPGRDELAVRAADGPATALLVGGEPFPDELHMWWNFVGRSHEDIELAADEWNAGAARFGTVASELERIPAPRPPWRRA